MVQPNEYYDDSSVIPAIGSTIHGYTLIKELTKTLNSFVISAKNTRDDSDVAIKFIKYRQKCAQRVIEEVKLMSEIRCPFITEAIDIFDYAPYKCVVMPLAVANLRQIAQMISPKKFSEKKVKKIMFSALQAIDFLHKRNICHRDIKPENILMFDNGKTKQFKLCDLGFARVVPENGKCTEYLGTLAFAAPEVISCTPYDISVDIWSLGVTMYTLLCGETPFPAQSERATRTGILTCSYFFPANMWKGISKEAKDLICHMIKKNPAARYTAEQCLSHPWFSNSVSTSCKMNSDVPSVNMMTHHIPLIIPA